MTRYEIIATCGFGVTSARFLDSSFEYDKFTTTEELAIFEEEMAEKAAKLAENMARHMEKFSVVVLRIVGGAPVKVVYEAGRTEHAPFKAPCAPPAA